MKVYLTDLKEKGACISQIKKFKEIFGEEVEVTVENINKAYNNKLNFNWYLENVLYKTLNTIAQEFVRSRKEIKVRKDLVIGKRYGHWYFIGTLGQSLDNFTPGVCSGIEHNNSIYSLEMLVGGTTFLRKSLGDFWKCYQLILKYA